MQVPVPEQAPPQPTKIESGASRAVSWTGVPGLNDPLQGNGGKPGPTPQTRPEGTICTLPPPFSVLMRFTASRRGPRNSAVTVAFCVKATVHRPVPVQSPPQPTKMASGAGCAVRVTTVPEL